MKHKDLGGYVVSERFPGVDPIIEHILTGNPDFDHPEKLKRKLEKDIMAFTADIIRILSE